MTAPRPPALPGRLAANVLHFSRVLRAAGVPLPTDRVELALAALPVAGLASRQDFHDTLAACLVDRAEHRELFDQAFDLYWRNPDLAGRMRALLLPRVQARVERDKAAAAENRRLADAMFPHRPPPPADAGVPDTETVEAPLTWNDRELLRKADFETMTADEWRAAQRLLREMAPRVERIATRRGEPAPGPGRLDGRATLRALARQGGDGAALRWRRPRTRAAPLLVLADISGSMSRHSRMLLHYMHALGQADLRVESFVFGTRLTRTTRALRQRDPDRAVARVVRDVADWSGGTRITTCLHEFNRHWARRVMDSRTSVVLITDGLEHGSPDDPCCDRLRFEMERLRKGCRRIVWLNPLLRFDAFEPRAAGIRAMLQQVDAFLPAHNLHSLEQLSAVLARAPLRASRPGRA